MARIEIGVGDGPTRLRTEISSWFAKDVQKLAQQFLDKIAPIAVKDLVDLSIEALKREQSEKIARMDATVREWRDSYDALKEQYRELERRKS